MHELNEEEYNAIFNNEDSLDIAMVPYRYEYLVEFDSGYKYTDTHSNFYNTSAHCTKMRSDDAIPGDSARDKLNCLTTGRVCQINRGRLCRFCEDSDEQKENSEFR